MITEGKINSVVILQSYNVNSCGNRLRENTVSFFLNVFSNTNHDVSYRAGFHSLQSWAITKRNSKTIIHVSCCRIQFLGGATRDFSACEKKPCENYIGAIVASLFFKRNQRSFGPCFDFLKVFHRDDAIKTFRQDHFVIWNVELHSICTTHLVLRLASSQKIKETVISLDLFTSCTAYHEVPSWRPNVLIC